MKKPTFWYTSILISIFLIRILRSFQCIYFKILEFSDKILEKLVQAVYPYVALVLFFDYFFLSSKVSKMKFNQKSLIFKNTKLYDIDFYQKNKLLIKYLNIQRRIEKQLNRLIKKTIAETFFLKWWKYSI